MVRGETEKRLDCARIAEIRQAAGTFLTLHGGSGTNAADLRAAVRAGITIAHVNTELRVAWRRGLDGALSRKPDEVVPYSDDDRRESSLLHITSAPDANKEIAV